MSDYVYANFGLTCVDDTHIYIGEHTMIGPNCVLATANHPILPELREKASTRCHKPGVPPANQTFRYKKGRCRLWVRGCSVLLV